MDKSGTIKKNSLGKSKNLVKLENEESLENMDRKIHNDLENPES